MALQFVVMECLHYLCSGLVELIVIVQAQHINNRKYINSCTINDECIQTIVSIDIAMLKEMSSQFFM
jgi:hypothetical protein